MVYISFSEIQTISSCIIKLTAFLFAANLLYRKDVPYCNWTALCSVFALEGQNPYKKKNSVSTDELQKLISVMSHPGQQRRTFPHEQSAGSWIRPPQVTQPKETNIYKQAKHSHSISHDGSSYSLQKETKQKPA